MRKIHLTGPVLALVAVGLAACGSGSSSTSTSSGAAATSSGAAASDKTVTVKVSVAPFAAYAPLYVGIKAGIFTKHHLKVIPEPSGGGSESVTALISGSVQFADPDAVATLTAASKGLPVRVVGLASQGGSTPETDYSCLAVRKPSIKGPKDMEGKTVAVNSLNNIVTLSLKGALSKQGVDVSKVKFAEIPVPDEPVALEQNRVDGVSVTEPFCSFMESKGARSLSATFADTTPDMLTGVWVTTQKYIDDHGDVARNFAAAISEANVYSVAHPEVVREVVPTFTQIPAAAAKTMKLPSWTAGLNRSSLALIDELSRKFGMYDKKVDTGSLVPSFVTE
ncbi:MAG: NitT/TauT family transport system substrate-binding protein [Solirubrobacteraceae bacterium]|nr:NitT/TauT family transport system substrate-binding protein [Solirubrobacteraceae bacterium]